MSDKISPIRDAVQSAEPIQAAPDASTDKPQKKKRRDFSCVRLPAGCPVDALGIHGNDFYYLDARRQMKVYRPSDHSRLGVLALFGQKNNYLYTKWPRISKDGDVVGWTPDKVAESLMAAAAGEGVLDVVDRVRGPGAWKDEDDNLVLHCGDTLYNDGKKQEPGMIGRYIYPSAPEKPRPSAGAPVSLPAENLLSLFKTWKWRREGIDPHLLLGWIGASMIGGALKWRPMIWITGDKATGKSTLHDVIGHVHGPGGMISTPDGTAASLWQNIGHASLPVAMDELEAEEDNRRNASIIKLARIAASGGTLLRGGSDHKGVNFTVRSCFMFSSILIPPMMAQDVSRMAILQLDSLEGVSAPILEPKKLASFGADFRKRLILGWERLPETLQVYRTALEKTGHGGRSADLFGTLLACYDLLMFDEVPSEEDALAWGEKLDKATLSEADDDVADHESCLNHIMTSVCDVYRNGERRQIGSWIAHAVKDINGRVDANKVLASFGMKVQPWMPENQRPSSSSGKSYIPANAPMYLMVANRHQGLSKLFMETHWAGKSGTSGVWVQAFRRVSGACAGGSLRFDGVPSRCTAIPIDSIFSEKD
jgi:hypothetical protein